MLCPIVLVAIITYSTSKNGVLELNGTQYATGSDIVVNDNTVTINVANTAGATNGQARITKITIYYGA